MESYDDFLRWFFFGFGSIVNHSKEGKPSFPVKGCKKTYALWAGRDLHIATRDSRVHPKYASYHL